MSEQDSLVPVRFTISIKGVESDLRLLEADHHEQISANYELTITFASHDHNIDTFALLERLAVVTIIDRSQGESRLSGIITNAEYLGVNGQDSHYKIIVKHSSHRLELVQDHRHFMQKTTPDILQWVANKNQIEIDLVLTRQYPVIEYTVQYGESYANLIYRFFHREGIFSFFDFSVKGIPAWRGVDRNESCKSLAINRTVNFNASQAGMTQEPHARAFFWQDRMESTELSRRSFSKDKPDYNQEHRFHARDLPVPSTDLAVLHGNYENYSFCRDYVEDAVGKPYTQHHLEALRADSSTGTLHTNLVDAHVGQWFELKGHPRAAFNRRYLIIKVHTAIKQPQGKDQNTDAGAASINTTLTVIDLQKAFRAKLNKPYYIPTVTGVMNAQVVTNEKEEVVTDELGRVKVRDFANRHARDDESASCFIQVSNQFAGSGIGSLFIPRKGQLLFIGFINGSPDLPVILGRSYHDAHRPPYALPKYKMRSVLARSRTFNSSGSDFAKFNEISFLDTPEEEELYQHASRDHVTHVGHDMRAQVDHDDMLRVGNEQFYHIKSHARRRIDGSLFEKIGQDVHRSVGGNEIVEIQGNLHLKVSGEIVLESGSKFTAKAGQAISIDPGKVGVGGKVVLGGASPSSASSPSPVGQLSVEDSPELKPPSYKRIAAMEVMVAQNAPMMSLCMEQTDGSCPLDNCPCGKNTNSSTKKLSTPSNTAISDPPQSTGRVHGRAYENSIEYADDFRVEYTQKAVQLAVMSLEEAEEFAENLWIDTEGKDTLGDGRKLWGGASAVRDAYLLAKGLGGMGVIAYSKTINGQDYIIIKNYRKHLKTIVKGNIWKANNPQVRQLGLGNANMARNVLKVGLVVDIAFAVAINAVDTMIHDEKTMVDFVGYSGADIVKGVIATGAGIGAAAGAATIFGAGVLITGVVFAGVAVISGFSIDAIDNYYEVSDNLVDEMKSWINQD